MKPDKIFVADNATSVILGAAIKCRPSDIEYLRKEAVLDYLQQKHDQSDIPLYGKALLACVIHEIQQM